MRGTLNPALSGALVLTLSACFSEAFAQSQVFRGQQLQNGALSYQLARSQTTARVICNRFNTRCFGYGSLYNPNSPVLFRASDNTVFWCDAQHVGNGYNTVELSSVWGPTATSSTYGTKIFPFTSATVPSSAFWWMELTDGGDLVLYESVVAYKLFSSLMFNESQLSWRGIIPVGWDYEGWGSHSGAYAIVQVWDGPLNLVGPGGGLVHQFSNHIGRTFQVGYYGDIWADNDGVNVWHWQYIPNPIQRPAYWRVGDDGNFELIQGRELGRISGQTPMPSCQFAPSPPAQPGIGGGGGGGGNPTPAPTGMVQLLIPGVSPPATVPAAVNHPSPW